LITGASRGMGLEFVRQYAADGWKVLATCRRPETAERLRAVEGDVKVYPLDVTDFAKVDALARQLKNEVIDVLINNAGIYGPRQLAYDRVDFGAWAEVMRTNAMAPLKVSAAFVSHVGRSEQRRIAAMSSRMSSMADNTSGGSYIYRSSKAALNAAMRSLAIDLKASGIAVVLLNPGWVRTDMGGPGAEIEAFESVAGMRQIIASLRMAESGRFFNFDGTDAPW
jgi:NAD(P)-dependent dehydrogenase (short-subunit alcohol dehydrogenase family)